MFAITRDELYMIVLVFCFALSAIGFLMFLKGAEWISLRAILQVAGVLSLYAVVMLIVAFFLPL